MTFPPMDRDDDLDEVNPPVLPPEPDAAIALEQGRHLRHILVAFVVVVLLLPFAGLGGALGWLIVPIVGVAGYALREAIRLRTSVRRHGAARGR